MLIENLTITGYRTEGSTRNDSINPTRQSTGIDFGENILIARPMIREFSGFEPEIELRRRLDAVNLHERYLPGYTPPCQFVILQGRRDDTGELVGVLGRFMPKYENVRPITDLSDKQIMNDPDICRALAVINFNYLRVLLSRGIIIDYGGPGKFGKDLARPIAWAVRYLVTSNIMIGIDQSGAQKIICDPDWYSHIAESENPAENLKKGIKTFVNLAAKTVFFGC